MIDIAKYTGVDDSNFAVKLGIAQKFIYEKWDNGGAAIGVRYCKNDISQKENQLKIVDEASRIYLSRKKKNIKDK